MHLSRCENVADEGKPLSGRVDLFMGMIYVIHNSVYGIAMMGLRNHEFSHEGHPVWRSLAQKRE